jgi:transcription-repair coupling factor (superfamily II helicase)
MTYDTQDDGGVSVGGLDDGLAELALAGAYPIDDLVAGLRASGRVSARGVSGALGACLTAQVASRLGGRRIVVLTPDERSAVAFAGDVALFGGGGSPASVVRVPTGDTSPYGDVLPDRSVALQRLTAFFRLPECDFAVLSIEGLARKMAPPDVLFGMSASLVVGTPDLTNERLRGLLADAGYTAVSLVEDPGTFAIRGDIVDLWSPFEPCPVRLERWGDEVTSVRAFDPKSQRTSGDREGVFLLPVREAVSTPTTVACAREKLRAAADLCHVPSKRVARLISEIEAGVHLLGIQGLLPAYYPQLGCLPDLIDDDAILVIVDPGQCDRRLDDLWRSRGEEYARRLDAHELAFAPGEHYLRPSDVRDWIASRRVVLRLEDIALTEADQGDEPLRFRVRPNTDVVQLRRERSGAEGTIKALTELIPAWSRNYTRVVFVCHTAGDSERLEQLLDNYGVETVRGGLPLDPDAVCAEPGPVTVLRGELSGGFRTPALGLAVIAGHEVFGRRSGGDREAEAPRSFADTAAIASFRDLSRGDLVVHTEFGIGRYGGLAKMEVGGVEGDFLLLEYSGRDKVYLPVYKLSRVQKYIGGDRGTRLDKLGGVAWERTKERVKSKLKELAIDLIDLYARRQAHPGRAFPKPDAYYREFEAAFAFQPTRDQGKAIEAIIDDLSSNRVTDRLVCGDVGFGKTEVAMRAAFVVVMGGAQVAVLCPTTVLCEQHLRSFRSRFDGYPVRIEALSRFRSAEQTKAIITDVESGRVDVLIGTHRLLSKDVKFRHLGLLVVDEEQRFGVGHKEKLKSLKTQIDCITMSATPIPRTLQMSLTGLRDLSIIATPPPGRLAVRTHIARFGESVIREAILREIQRDGQVFFVHNRVETIEEMAANLREWVPEARVAVGHGQMKVGALEKVMLGFVRRDFNVLLSTTIIESGLDISNANTMLIDRADTFGLSQLYQLRGRIGRSTERAYCYLLVRSTERLSGVARERLDVIERFTELGSGFHVASYDMEIRGAGNLLGPEQSGSVAMVGLDLYSELLTEAIAEVRGEEVEVEVEPEVNVPVPAFLPEDYVMDISLRLLFYKRLNLARSEEELFDIYSELADRFGKPPVQVEALRDVIGVKLLLRRIAAARIDVGPGAVHIHLGERPNIGPQQTIDLMHSARGRYVLTPQMKLIRRLHPDEAQDPLRAARLVCHEVLEAAGLA